METNIASQEPPKLIKTPDVQAYNEGLAEELNSPEFDIVLDKPLSILELEEKLHVERGSDGRKHLPLSPILLTAALQSEEKDIFDNRKNIYRDTKDNMNNLEEVDLGIADENIRTYKHAQRAGYNNIRIILAYQLLHELRMENQDAKLDRETFEKYQFTPEQYLRAIKIGLAGLLHDLGKSEVVEINELGYKIFKQRDTLISEKKYTDEQRERMIDHRKDGEQMIRRSGLPEYYAYVAAHHHDDNDAFVKPLGFTFEEILESNSFGAFITKMQDQYDAGRSKRPYKEAKSHQEMKEDKILLKQHDVYGDDELADAFQQNAELQHQEAEEMLIAA